MHVQRISEMIRCLYTGGNFQQFFFWKNPREMEDLIYEHDLTN